MSSSSTFRPEVQGLRALAVLSVVFYHLGWTWIEGGFVGVDVFFVISGFLITGIIKRGTEAGTFNYWQFSVSRVRRLYPALVVTLALTFAVGAWMLAPKHLQEFAASTVWALGSLSNIFFLNGQGYFGTAQEFQPLLHTWSLGVEVQFYVVWPVFVWAIVKYLSPRAALLSVVAMAIASLALAEFWITKNQTETAFFLMPARIVEFAIGGALVWFIDRQPAEKRLLEPVAAVGAALIVYSALTYCEAMHFPGLTALVPCLGSAMLIYAGGGARWAGWLFRTRPAVYVGNISYALYLVHWPVIVFYGYYKFTPRTLLDDAVIVALCFALAAALHVLIEKPFQGKALGRLRLSTPVLLGGLAACIALVAVPALSAERNGWSWRTPLDHRELLADASHVRGPKMGGDTKSSRKVLLLGDSHAMHFRFLLSRYFKAKGYKVDYQLPRCVTLPDVTRVVDGVPDRRCEKYWENVLSIVSQKGYDAVIIGGRWTTSTQGTGDYDERTRTFFLTDKKDHTLSIENSQRAFKEAVARLTSFAEKKRIPLLIIGQVPPMGANLEPCLFLHGSDCRPLYTKAEVKERLAFTNEVLAKAADGKEYVSFVNSFDVICGGAKDYCPTIYRNTFLYADSHHLSYKGSQALIGLFSKDLDRFMRYTER
ncbi:acyltransferase family protein [Corticibacterium sp. UT-5YL-CI-8]|nr:acyltransferase family protein [Tianweitania sp. UT-5YL-CI-8]